MFRAVARPLLASTFLLGGWRQLRHPEAVTKQAAPVVAAVARQTPLPDNPELLVRVNGGVMVAAGAALAAGAATRPSALVLAGALVPTTIAGHPFWQAPPEDRAKEVAQFAKNAGIFAGLLLLATQPTRRGTAPRKVRRAERKAARAERAAAASVAERRREAKRSARQAKREAAEARSAARRKGRHADGSADPAESSDVA